MSIVASPCKAAQVFERSAQPVDREDGVVLAVEEVQRGVARRLTPAAVTKRPPKASTRPAMPSCRATSSSDSTAPCEKPPRQVAAGPTPRRCCCASTQGAAATCAATRAARRRASRAGLRSNTTGGRGGHRRPAWALRAPARPPAGTHGAMHRPGRPAPRFLCPAVQQQQQLFGLSLGGPVFDHGLHVRHCGVPPRSPAVPRPCRLCSAPPYRCKLPTSSPSPEPPRWPCWPAAWHGLARPAAALGRAVRAVHGLGALYFAFDPWLRPVGERVNPAGTLAGRGAAADDAGRADRLRRAAPAAGAAWLLLAVGVTGVLLMGARLAGWHAAQGGFISYAAYFTLFAGLAGWGAAARARPRPRPGAAVGAGLPATVVLMLLGPGASPTWCAT
jgi:hypothetical protein